MTRIKEKTVLEKGPKEKNFRKGPWKRLPKLNSGHPKATHKFFTSNEFYNDLTDFFKRFAEIFWTKRFCNLSFSELAEDLKMEKTSVFTLFSLLESKGLIKPKKKFRFLGGKKSKARCRTHKPLTRKGQKLMNAIVQKAWKGTPIPKHLDPGIQIIDGVPKLEGNLRPCDKKKLQKQSKENIEEFDVENIFETLGINEIFENETVKKVLEIADRFLFLRNKNKKNKLRETAVSSSSFSFEGIIFSVWKPSSFDSGSKTMQFITLQTSFIAQDDIASSDLAKAYATKAVKNKDFDFKNSSRRKLFEKYSLLFLYDDYLELKNRLYLEKQPLKKLSKVLKYLKKKLNNSQKRFRPKNLVAFFVYLMNNAETLGFNHYLAKLYDDAINRPMDPYPAMKRLRDGVDTGAFIDGVRDIQLETGQELSQETIARMLSSKGKKSELTANLWLKALEAVRFRMRKFDIDNWVGLWVYAVNLGSTEAIKAKFYKARAA